MLVNSLPYGAVLTKTLPYCTVWLIGLEGGETQTSYELDNLNNMSYETIWEEEGAYQRFIGQVSLGEWVLASDEIRGDHRFDTMRYWIIDDLGIELYELTDTVTKRPKLIIGA